MKKIFYLKKSRCKKDKNKLDLMKLFSMDYDKHYIEKSSYNSRTLELNTDEFGL